MINDIHFDPDRPYVDVLWDIRETSKRVFPPGERIGITGKWKTKEETPMVIHPSWHDTRGYLARLRANQGYGRKPNR